MSCCANSSCGGGETSGGGVVILILPPSFSHPTRVWWSGAGPGAFQARRRRRGCARCSPPCAGPLSRLQASPYQPPSSSAAPLNPASRPASRLALNNCLPPAKRPWGKYLLNGNNCRGSREGPRLFQAYWFLAPALVNKPAPKRPRRAARYPPPACFRERPERETRSRVGGAAGEGSPGRTGGQLPRPLRAPPYPSPGHGCSSTGNFVSLPAGSRRRWPFSAGVPLLAGAPSSK